MQVEMPSLSERRKRVRTKVHWRVLLFRTEAAESIVSLTENLSSGGFYCLADTPFTVGEALICSLKVPKYNGNDLDRRLECKTRVLRVEPRDDGLYGIACRIEDYEFAQIAADRAQHASGAVMPR